MPRDGAIIFTDLIGKLEMLHVTCDKCERDGCYMLARFIRNRGRDANLMIGSTNSPPNVRRRLPAT